MNLKSNTSSFKKNTEILHQIRCFVSFKKLQDWVDLNIYSFLHVKKYINVYKRLKQYHFSRHMLRHRQ